MRGRSLVLAVVLVACAELDAEISEPQAHVPAAPEYAATVPLTTDAGDHEGAAAVDADAGAHEGAAAPDAEAGDYEEEDAAPDSDAAPVAFACVNDAQAPDGACKWVVKGSTVPCFETQAEACACLGCPAPNCLSSGPRLCLPPPKADAGKVCKPRYVWCGDAAVADAPDQ
jgi:hypothetical protein